MSLRRRRRPRVRDLEPQQNYQSQMMQERTEMNSEAVTQVERMINDLVTMYTQLTTMVAEQGDLVDKIGTNVDDSHMNIQAGFTELLKYLQYIKSNRPLIIKVFLVWHGCTLLFWFFRNS